MIYEEIRELLTVGDMRPMSTYEIASILDRDPRNIHTALVRAEKYKLVERAGCKRTPRGQLSQVWRWCF